MVKSHEKKLKLMGFNNLTKTLSFNIYDINYAANAEQQKAYIEYIDEEYNAERLTRILTEVSNLIGATVLNIAHQDYDPMGASVTMLISEEPIISEELSNAEAPGPLPETGVVATRQACSSTTSTRKARPGGCWKTTRTSRPGSTVR